MSPIEREIIKTEADLRIAQRRYAQANARKNMNEALRWGTLTRELIQRLEDLGNLHDNGRGAWAVARA